VTTTAPETRPVQTMAGAIHSNCRCLHCRVGYNNWQRNRKESLAQGTWQPWVDATPAREHIEHLHRSGMSYNVIAHLAKLRTEDIQRIRTNIGNRPRSRRIRPDTADAILAVRLHFSRLPPRSLVPTLGAVRRIQALRAIGWPAYVLAERSGMSKKGMASLLVQPRAQVSTHLRIAALYELLFDQNPVEHGIDPVMALRGRHLAAKYHWAVPAAWTDIDTDAAPDTRIRGGHFQKAPPRARQSGVVEDTAELAKLGVSRSALVERLGISWDAIMLAHRRAGVAMPVQLQQENASMAATPEVAA
jgi:hypothetical protein